MNIKKIIQTYLHSRLDNIERGVSEDRRGTGNGPEAPGEQLGHSFGAVTFPVHVLQRLNNKEADRLVRTLLHHRRRHSLVYAPESCKQTSKLWMFLTIDHFHACV